MVKVLLPSLKGLERATVKAKEKYGGAYNRLTDLVRVFVSKKGGYGGMRLLLGGVWVIGACLRIRKGGMVGWGFSWG